MRGLDSGHTLAMATHRAISEVLHRLGPVRRVRSNARVVRRKMSKWHVKRAAHQGWPQSTLPISMVVQILGPPYVMGIGVRALRARSLRRTRSE
jgi:hypothetical protein